MIDHDHDRESVIEAMNRILDDDVVPSSQRALNREALINLLEVNRGTGTSAVIAAAIQTRDVDQRVWFLVADIEAKRSQVHAGVPESWILVYPEDLTKGHFRGSRCPVIVDTDVVAKLLLEG